MTELHTYRNLCGTLFQAQRVGEDPGAPWCITARLSFAAAWRPVKSLGTCATAAAAERQLHSIALGHGWEDVGVAVPSVTKWEEADDSDK